MNEILLQSTRSSLTANPRQAVLNGIAPDGGLYVDPLVSQRSFDVEACLKLSYLPMAEKIMSFLLPGLEDGIASGVAAYPKKFSTKAIVPLKHVGDNFVLELYHGPTSAFKDLALTVLPHLVGAARQAEKIEEKICILTATSGDTGKAALEGFHDVPGTEITVFFPHNGVSEMQKLQMLTQEGNNVRVAAVKGNFDDCQQGVKRAFAKFNESPVAGRIFSSANSINIGRLVPQVVYYFSAYSQLMNMGRISYGDSVDFIVPTGNFGDILAGYIAKLMGLPVGKLVCAANSNNVLHDFISTGIYDKRRSFVKTASPSMDILVSSNLERLLFYASNGDTGFVSDCMSSLSNEGVYTVPDSIMNKIRADFSSDFATEDECSAAIAKLWKENNYLADTHTAVGWAVLEKYRHNTSNPCVVLSTASPFKFPSAVLSAIGGETGADEFETAEKLSELTHCQIPKNLSGLKEKEILHNDVIPVEELVEYALK